MDFPALLIEAETVRARSLNLIASENRMSPLVRRLLATDASSRYYFEGSDPPAFPGGNGYAALQQHGETLLGRLGKARHVNMRPLSGLHAMTIIITAVTQAGDTIVSLAPEHGGHYATGALCRRFGRQQATFPLTDEMELAEDALWDVLKGRPKLLYIDQCHGLFPLPLKRIAALARDASPDTLVHADVSHGLGLVLGGALENPLESGCDSFGGSTHKTLPGPQKGVLLTNSDEIAAAIAQAQFELISNHHLNAALSLSAALWEFETFGGAVYAAKVAPTAQRLAAALHQAGIPPVAIRGRYSGWHQLWVPEFGLAGGAQVAARRLATAGIMVNVLPDLPGQQPFALRVGVSEICHLGLGDSAIDRLGALIAEVVRSEGDAARYRSETVSLIETAPCPYDFASDRDEREVDPESEDALRQPWSLVEPTGRVPSFVAGRGCRIFDESGRSWLDAKSGALNATLGFGRADIAAATHDQQLRLMSSDAVGATSVPAKRLARRIASLTGGELVHTLFCNSGSEAVEASIKIALACWSGEGANRRRFVAFENSYHGCTMGALALTQLTFAKEGMDWLPNQMTERLPVPRGEDDIAAAAALLERSRGPGFAAVILEPVQGIGGIHVFPDAYLVALRRLCDRTGTLLILDEVFTGFGRTGHMFAYQASGAVPDILLTSKGLTAGYVPISAVSMRRSVLQRLKEDPVFPGLRHGHTMSGNATACAAALRVIDVLEQEDLVENARRMGERLIGQLRPLVACANVLDVRGRGLMLGIEMTSDALAREVVDYCARTGVLLREQRAVVQIVPPLTIGATQCDEIAAVIEAAVVLAETRAA